VFIFAMKKPNVSFQFPIPTHRFPQGPIFGAKKFSQFAIKPVLKGFTYWSWF